VKRSVEKPVDAEAGSRCPQLGTIRAVEARPIV
jgi:hypothetical protein